MPTSAPRTARERVRLELTAEIKQVARRHLADEGASALSLRAVARELGMVSSAVYRYFPSRDDLLTALIVDAYDAVGAAAEVGDDPEAATGERWFALAHAIRGWAIDHPQEYSLIYGSPVPGYRAPAGTIDPAARVAIVYLNVVADGVSAGDIARDDPSASAGERVRMPRAVRADLSALRAQAAPHVPDAVLSRAMLVWAMLFGSISFELFGHLHNIIHDFDGFFEVQMRHAGRFLVDGA